MFRRMLDDVPMFGELAVTDSENLPANPRRSRMLQPSTNRLPRSSVQLRKNRNDAG